MVKTSTTVPGIPSDRGLFWSSGKDEFTVPVIDNFANTFFSPSRILRPNKKEHMLSNP